MEVRTYRWLPVVVLTAAVLGLILTQSILATQGVVEITYPKQNDTLYGVVEIRGSASDDNMAYYQLEYSAQGGSWTPIGPARYQKPVNDGPLGTWDTTQVPPGTYQLRLNLTDRMGNHIQNTIMVEVAAPETGP